MGKESCRSQGRVFVSPHANHDSGNSHRTTAEINPLLVDSEGFSFAPMLALWKQGTNKTQDSYGQHCSLQEIL
jgi:hypothetical protein